MGLTRLVEQYFRRDVSVVLKESPKVVQVLVVYHSGKSVDHGYT